MSFCRSLIAMPIRRVVANSLQCIVNFYLLIKLLCSGRGRTLFCSGKEGMTEDQGASETGNASCDSIKHDPPRKKGVYFLSTSTIADGDTPVIIPWRTTSETHGDPDALSEKLSTRLSHITSQCSSYDISLCSRSIYDDSSIIGLSLLFESDEESYIDEDTTYDFFQTDHQEVFLNNAGQNRIQPMHSQWNLEVAAAMNAFRSSRVDHDDIVLSVTTASRDNHPTPPINDSGDSVEASQKRQIEEWRNDFIPEQEASSSTPPRDVVISRFRFP